MSLPSLLKEQQSEYQGLLEIVRKHEHLGKKVFPDGSQAIGHVPHVAPLAYLHRLFSPLDESEVKTLQDQLEFDFPESLKAFYAIHNGLSLFSDFLSLDGLRRSWQRSNFEAVVQQPYHIRNAQINFMPKAAPTASLVIGTFDGERNPITINPEGQISMWPNKEAPSPTRKYGDIFKFLRSEAQFLSTIFNESGRKIAK